MSDNERADATFKANFPNGLPKPVTQYDLAKAWDDGWRTCLQDKEPEIRADERRRLLGDLEGEMRYWDPRDAPADLKDWIAEKRGTDD